MIASLTNTTETIDALLLNETRQCLLAAPNIPTCPESYSVGLIEIFRATGSAILKGKKELEFLLHGFQEQDANGHYQDNTLMMFIVAPFSLIYGVYYALRAFVKGYSKDLSPKKVVPELLSQETILQEREHLRNHDTESEKTDYYPLLYYRFFGSSLFTKSQTTADQSLNLPAYQGRCTF